ncbi:sigma-54-dependent Fis family transcriptional regulator [Natranaerobius thermophilus]|uniref:Putative sigma54 specific transcriptional regulator n=1 Tax=Natranaerobius thermophilus (strain ATCC BAA-1301 / DSM 18059 / JW/NM-WN-LF) TaxID=457570 RepID=B2A7X5_NATTJ|nr:sigma-54-dependent Fis family transcriptional regulator [Natranaerobius thermophilus]ACB85747.1 putative sigma54 specific transcriptional regulator [Natranaerobius thermophilus JW/NM-WN-LF]
MDFSNLTVLTAGDAVIKDISIVSPSATVKELNEIMLLKKKEEVLVMENQAIVGVITKNDLVKNLATGIKWDTEVKYIMTRNVIRFKDHEDLTGVRDNMRFHGIKRAPVLNENEECLGLITVKSICDAFSNRLWHVVDYLQMVLNNLNEGVFILSSDGEVLYQNNALAGILATQSAQSTQPEIPRELLQKIQSGSGGDFVYHLNNKVYSVNVAPFPCNESEENKLVTIKNVTHITELQEQLSRANSKLNYLENTVSKISQEHYTFGNIFSVSPKMEHVIELAKQVAPTKATVLINGESGTGKELLANAIHQHSDRKDAPLITINCGAIPENLAESEFFGYCSGAFTGAKKEGKPGAFEIADGGTLFLDEIGDLPLNMQAKLLRALQEGSFYRVGGIEPVSVDVRIIAATNQNLEELVQNNQFREDLYYRINVANLELPPLREKTEDIMPLTKRFIDHFSQVHGIEITEIEQAVMDTLEEYHWPGNVRELKNVIERLVIFSTQGKISIKALPSYLHPGPKFGSQDQQQLHEQLHRQHSQDDNFSNKSNSESKIDELERKTILDSLKKHSFNKAKVARELNIPRSTLYYRMKVLNIN